MKTESQPFSVSPDLRGEPCRFRALAYVSLGSSGEKGILPEVLRTLVAQGCDVVLSGVNEREEARLRLAVPGWDVHVLAARLLDPRTVLARAALCVCHGGSGTVYQSLSAGVPLVCLPGNPDQGLVAQAVAACGAGVALAPGPGFGGRLAQAFASVRQDSAYRKHAQRLAEAMARHNARGRWLNFLAETVGAPETAIQVRPETHASAETAVNLVLQGD